MHIRGGTRGCQLRDGKMNGGIKIEKSGVQSHLGTMNKFDFDVAIIGGGSGGYAAARTAAGKGLRTAVIEGGKEVGGLCILRGCMPTKALLYAAEVKHLAQHPEVWGLQTGGVGFDLAKVMARKNTMVADFADFRVQQLNSGKFKFIRAMAQFTDAHTLALSTGGTLTAANFVISTGSVVAPPPMSFLKELDYLTSDDALALTRLPKSLIVLGGGAVAVEFAQFFARFDVKVTLIQRSPHVLKDLDADAAGVVEKVFRREGITVYTGTQLTGATRKDGMKQITFLHGGREMRAEAEEVLDALGRIPNTASLGLERAGVKTEAGRIVTNEEMQTSARHIYAAGDCVGSHDIVHIAVMQGEIAAHNIAQPETKRRMDYRLLISVVFTEPQLAVVGLTEKEAAARKIPYLAASHPFDDHGKSLIMQARDGFVKLLADPATGEIIGGCCAGPVGGELIHEIVAAMHKRMTVGELAAMPHYHPTLAEIWTYPAEELAEKIGKGQTVSTPA
jgi:pyruvate/2-oxoglutarate dehydrogenase complex dihydrolipoamide dehydrogenase (E3) component